MTLPTSTSHPIKLGDKADVVWYVHHIYFHGTIFKVLDDVECHINSNEVVHEDLEFDKDRWKV